MIAITIKKQEIFISFLLFWVAGVVLFVSHPLSSITAVGDGSGGGYDVLLSLSLRRVESIVPQYSLLTMEEAERTEEKRKGKMIIAIAQQRKRIPKSYGRTTQPTHSYQHVPSPIVFLPFFPSFFGGQ